MKQFVETIKIKDGKVLNLLCHQERMNRTIAHFFPTNEYPLLSSILHPTPDMTFHKARVVYGEHGIEDIQYSPYAMRAIHSLKLIIDDTIDYTYKSTDRSALNRLVAQKGECDDILIVKDGLLTDTSFTNIALWDGSHWLTPRTPLLKGTKRALLLNKGTIREVDLTIDDLCRCKRISLINAMIDLGEIELESSAIFQ